MQRGNETAPPWLRNMPFLCSSLFSLFSFVSLYIRNCGISTGRLVRTYRSRFLRSFFISVGSILENPRIVIKDRLVSTKSFDIKKA